MTRPERGTPRQPPPGRGGDPGLQLERTMLAWRRTAAAFLVAAAVSARLLVPLLGGWAYPAVLVPALGAFAVGVAGRMVPLRHPPAAANLTTVRPRPGWLAAVAALTCLLGLAGAGATLAS
ncbi:DUF202 domain-containing protein [Micromonospora echinospora]|uniref:DUF202 domain-containing protein n=1 Tax=Micromonospora echinospora TaxID=1877 RepID=UPI0033DCB79D